MWSRDTVVARNSRLSWRVLEGEVVILYPEEGTLHRLNDTGTSVWEHLDGHRTLAELGGVLAKEFDVEEDEAVRDIQHLAAELVDAGLVEVVT